MQHVVAFSAVKHEFNTLTTGTGIETETKHRPVYIASL
ncbi:hypothetical protein BTN49_0575 [Candidatus Enterovibrio escicola]|uniref:Uncharacterized protein n=1 Tax=Candidatus Enterovibrio escicola TaxID=1927127 RepID=A0A2A5T632_9GAMM|nr:hypothetical protein BTN49_0575 [Candidatus Enterovibrio escacola]